jgi:hypothetical protein
MTHYFLLPQMMKNEPCFRGLIYPVEKLIPGIPKILRGRFLMASI